MTPFVQVFAFAKGQKRVFVPALFRMIPLLRLTFFWSTDLIHLQTIPRWFLASFFRFIRPFWSLLSVPFLSLLSVPFDPFYQSLLIPFIIPFWSLFSVPFDPFYQSLLIPFISPLRSLLSVPFEPLYHSLLIPFFLSGFWSFIFSKSGSGWRGGLLRVRLAHGFYQRNHGLTDRII
jgi:hypothetical protein